MKRYLKIIVSMLVFAGCAATQDNRNDPVQMPVREIVALYPAETGPMQNLLNHLLLAKGHEGIYTVCTFLEDTTGAFNTRAEYALSGIVLQAPKGKYQMIEQALLDALNSSASPEIKRFLLERLRICGSDNALGRLGGLLNDPLLAESAVQTLCAIGSDEAAELMVRSLPEVDPEIRVSLINALGDLNYREAGPILFSLIGSEKEPVRTAALNAVSDLGYLPAEDLLYQNYAKSAGLYLRYLDRIKDNSLRMSRARQLLNDAALEDNHRVHAAGIMLKVEGSRVIPEIYNAVRRADPSLQMDILRLMMPWYDPDARRFFINTLADAPPAEKCNIIRFLGSLADPGLTADLAPYLSSGSVSVRSETIRALAAAGPSIAADLLLRHYRADITEQESEALLTAVKRIPFTDLEHVLPDLWDTGSDDHKRFYASVIADRGVSSMNDRLVVELISGPEDLGPAMLHALAVTGDTLVFEAVLRYGLAVSDLPLKGAAKKTLIDIYGRQVRTPDMDTLLIQAFKRGSDAEKTWLLGVMRFSGSRSVLGLASEEVLTASGSLNEEAFRAIVDWQNPIAIDTLVKFSRIMPDQRQRILAVRAVLRLVRTAVSDTTKRLRYYRELLTLAERYDEKQMVIAAISELGSVDGIPLIADYLEDPDLEVAARTALYKILHDTGNQSTAEILSGIIPEAAAAASDDAMPLTEPPPGFVSLFNGTDLDGWRGRPGDPAEVAALPEMRRFNLQLTADSIMHAHWTVQEGILHFDGQGENICTEKSYRNFELLVDWKIEPGGDSGIYLRGIPQVQIWDIQQNSEGSGGLYNNKISENKPIVAADHPPGEWNRFRIIMTGERVTVYLNDQLVVDDLRLENYWERGTPPYSTGPIELQAHNSPVYFKNIYIRVLPDSAGSEAVSLFNGKDLSGWQIVGEKPESWNVRDGVLIANPDGGGWLASKREYDNFELQLAFRVPPGGNSGVFIRAPLYGDPAYTGIEIQILDDLAEKYANLKTWQYTGSVYDISAPELRVSKPAGVWQALRIRCIGPDLQIELNGRKINDISLIDHMHREKSHPGIKRRGGFIGLQNHGSAVEFKEISITEIFGKGS